MLLQRQGRGFDPRIDQILFFTLPDDLTKFGINRSKIGGDISRLLTLEACVWKLFATSRTD